jgi:hypothetical protein
MPFTDSITGALDMRLLYKKTAPVKTGAALPCLSIL